MNQQWKLRDLFEVHYGATPYILLIRDGYTYRYQGSNKDRTAMINFARMGHLELDCVTEAECLGGTKSPLPQMPTLWDELSELF